MNNRISSQESKANLDLAEKLKFTYVSTSSMKKPPCDRVTKARRSSYCEVPSNLLGLSYSNDPIIYTKERKLGFGFNGEAWLFTCENSKIAPIVVKEMYQGLAAAFHEAKIHQAINQSGGYAIAKDEKRERARFYTAMKFAPGMPLAEIKFADWPSYLAVASWLVSAVSKFHQVAVHNDLHCGNIIVDENKVRLIDFASSDLKTDRTRFDRDMYYLWNELYTRLPNAKNTLQERKYAYLVAKTVDSVMVKPLESSLDNFKKITQQVRKFSEESLRQLNGIFSEKVTENKLQENKSIQHIQSLLAGYSDEKELNGAVDVVLGAIIKARNESMQSRAIFFKRHTPLSILLDNIIKTFKTYLAEQIDVPKEKFFLKQLKKR